MVGRDVLQRWNEPVRHLQPKNHIGEYKKRVGEKWYEELKKQRTNVIEIIEVKQSMQKVIDRY